MRAALLVFITFLYSQTALAESVPFEVCTESSTWMRPSPELQANKIWKDARYKGIGKDAYAWTHEFLVLDEFMNVSGILAVTNLSGLWTVKTQWLNNCYVDRQHNLSTRIEVVSLLHRVKEIQYDANTYTVVVEPSDKGFQWIFHPPVKRVGRIALCDIRGQAVRRLGRTCRARTADEAERAHHSQIMLARSGLRLTHVPVKRSDGTVDWKKL